MCKMFRGLCRIHSFKIRFAHNDSECVRRCAFSACSGLLTPFTGAVRYISALSCEPFLGQNTVNLANSTVFSPLPFIATYKNCTAVLKGWYTSIYFIVKCVIFFLLVL